jgi:hypothetical protein
MSDILQDYSYNNISKYIIKIEIEPLSKDLDRMGQCLRQVLRTNDILVEVNEFSYIIFYGKTEESLVKSLIALKELMTS